VPGEPQCGERPEGMLEAYGRPYEVRRERGELMMLDWEGYRQALLGRMGDLGRLSPQTIRGYREMSDAGSKTGHLDAKTRELIAIAVGVTRQCDGCITTHVHAARKQGATKEEVAEALGVAIAVNAGAALVFSARAMDALLGEAPE
jgi:AhpD family alkylhydroperoxidase